MKRFALVLALVAAALVPSRSTADHIGPLPGPSVLYAPLATAPQFTNTGDWSATSLRTSGSGGFAGGEYLYTDYIFDSFGANTTGVPLAAPDIVPNSSDTLFGSATGDVTYPTDAARYGFDAADLLEFRARIVDETHIAYRITLNTMLAPDAAAVAIGRDYGDVGSTDWGYGIGSLGVEVDDVVVTWGTGASAGSTSSADLARNQIEVVAPLPSAASIRHYIVVGLWDDGAHAFKLIADQPTADKPGGAHMTNPPPVFNVGFRFESQGDEPYGSLELNEKDPHLDQEGGERSVGFGHYRDHGQAKALAARDISAFGVDIDLAKLADDDLVEIDTPSHGWINRLYASHHEIAAPDGRTEGAQTNRPMFLGRVQPYGLYIPNAYDGSSPSQLMLQMHSLSSSYNQYAVYTPNLLRQLGDQRDSFILTPAGRGPDGWYHDEAELDVFEALADALQTYEIAFDHMTLGGYSMGGYGTLKFAAQYPDLFARGFAVVPPADENILGAPTGGAVESAHNTLRIADNVRNVPLLMWEGTNDELVPLAGTLQYDKRLDELGYRYTQRLLIGYDHFLESTVDEWAEGRDFLGEAVVDNNPEHVVYRAMPAMDNATFGLIHNHAYWVSDITVAGGARSGLIDARSEGTAVGRPVPYTTTTAGGSAAPLRGAWIEKGIDWTPTVQTPSNTLRVSTTDVTSATIWLARAHLDLDEPITVVVTTNAPVTLVFPGRTTLAGVTSGTYVI
jgi:predicted esterase